MHMALRAAVCLGLLTVEAKTEEARPSCTHAPHTQDIWRPPVLHPIYCHCLCHCPCIPIYNVIVLPLLFLLKAC